MIVPTQELLRLADDSGFAIGAFNIYNLEGALAIVSAAEQERSPAIIQIHPKALLTGGYHLIALARTAAEKAAVPMSVHLDHCTSKTEIIEAINYGVSSVMADGSQLSFEENITFTKEIVSFAHSRNIAVEAELGRISGTEDNLTVSEFEARYTKIDQAEEFVRRTEIDALAVCIGNVHGDYEREPQLDFDRLHAIDELTKVPLVLHGTSGLPDRMIKESIALGVRKFNVNTEIRKAYMNSLKEKFIETENPELVEIMEIAVSAMRKVIVEKIQLFGSNHRI